jgi:hypothetical protein
LATGSGVIIALRITEAEMTQGMLMLLTDAGWMAAGALVSLGALALAQRVQAWRAERANAEWDPY